MTPTSKKIHSLGALEKEIIELKRKSRKLEEKLDDNITHFQENYPSILINSLWPARNQYRSIPRAIAGLFLKQDRMQNAVNDLTERLSDKAAGLLEMLIKRIFH